MNIDEFISLLAQTGCHPHQQSGGNWTAHCPAHDDEHPSLSVAKRDGRILLHCHAGCSSEAVLAALGLTWGDLTTPQRRAKKEASPQTKHIINYEVRDEEGTVLAVHQRRETDSGKTFVWLLPNGSPSRGEIKPKKLPLYGIHRTEVQQAARVVLVEGEKPAEALWSCRIPALGTVCGASSTPDDKALAPLCSKECVVLWPDKDEEGHQHMLTIAQRLCALDMPMERLRWVTWTDAPPKGDAADAVAAKVNVEKLLETAQPVAEILALLSAEPPPKSRADTVGVTISETDISEAPSDYHHGQVVGQALKKRVCYSSRLGWLIYNDRRWERDEEDKTVLNLAAEALMKYYIEKAKAVGVSPQAKDLLKEATKCLSRTRAGNALAFAKAHLQTKEEEFDTNPYLLNTPSGVVDLRTRGLLSHSPDLKMTKITNASYDENAECPQFLNFLRHIMDGNERLVSYLQRLLGYALLGGNPERVFVIFYGSGANGKTTLLEAVAYALGDYVQETPAETFETLKSREVRPRNDLARLHGARLVTAAETKDGAKLDPALVKHVTGGDRIVARYLFREFFEFTPQFLPIVRTNFKPTVPGDDLALWDRLRLVPFTVRIPPETQDKHLAEKLREEAAGILRWLVEGGRAYLETNSLDEPEEARAATDSYRSEVDPICRFITERTEQDPEAQVTAKSLYDAYRRWCEEEGLEPISQTHFGRKMTNLRFQRIKEKSTRFYRGLKLKSLEGEQEPPEPEPTPEPLATTAPPDGGRVDTFGRIFL